MPDRAPITIDPAGEAAALGLPAGAFDRIDAGDDRDFYEAPRLVTHVDDAALAALTRHYAERLRAGDQVLDLMSSWISHLPPDLALAVVGHGMNAEELAANPRLDRFFVRDLNADPRLPEPDGAFDAVLICVGVQYLRSPLAVMREVARVLRPGGRVVASYSNRCFPTKAVAIWRSLDAAGHASLIARYLERAGFAEVEARLLADGRRGDPMIVVEGIAP